MSFRQSSGRDGAERSLLARRVVHVVTATAVAAAFANVLAGSASASALPHGCERVTTQLPIMVRCTYHERGQAEFAVSEGVSSIRVTVIGAHGGNGGGLGAVATGMISVRAGQRLYANVDVLGGRGGLVELKEPDRDNQAGGGESDLRTCSATTTCAGGGTLESRLLVAGGGGGSGQESPARGGNAGTSGNAAHGEPLSRSSGVQGGGGATKASPSAGGLGGFGDAADGSSGVFGAGGRGGLSWGLGPGGGGGGGWYGGGGGGGARFTGDNSGGGGGGSSHAAKGVTHAVFSQASAHEKASVTLYFADSALR
jgi:hypothetical protein